MKKSLGVIGGMGPLAAADFLRKIVLLTDAASDAEHIRIYLDNNVTVPDRSAVLSGGPSPVPALLESVAKLEEIGAECIAMPCNTAHAYLPQLQEHTSLPFVSIIDAAAEECSRSCPGGTVCVLATTVLVKSGLYSDALISRGMKVMHPGEQEQQELMELIYKVKEGRTEEPVLMRMEKLLTSLKEQGAECFILGCTELPVLTDLLGLSEGLVDSTTELAKAAIRFCGYSVRKANE